MMHEVHVIMGWLAITIDLTGSLIMIWVFVVSVTGFVVSSFKAGDERSRIHDLQVARCGLGVRLVFALELMIISDLLHTIVSRSIDDGVQTETI